MNKMIKAGVILAVFFLSVISSSAQEENPYEAMPVRDNEGNVYRVIMLESGIWMADNLNSFSLNDGTKLLLVRDRKAWANTKVPAYGWFSDDFNYCTTYGPIYNWHAVATGKLCPDGWHVPTEEEWNDLMDYAGGSQRSGNNPAKLKEKGTIHWKSPNTGANNEVFFNALPALGIKLSSDQPEQGTETLWWTSTEDPLSIDQSTGKASNANVVGLRYDFNAKTLGTFQKEAALPVRCKKNDE